MRALFLLARVLSSFIAKINTPVYRVKKAEKVKEEDEDGLPLNLADKGSSQRERCINLLATPSGNRTLHL